MAELPEHISSFQVKSSMTLFTRMCIPVYYLMCMPLSTAKVVQKCQHNSKVQESEVLAG